MEYLTTVMAEAFPDEGISPRIMAAAEAEADRILEEQTKSMLQALANLITFDGSTMSLDKTQRDYMVEAGLDVGQFTETLTGFDYTGSASAFYNALIESTDQYAQQIAEIIKEKGNEQARKLAEMFYSGAAPDEDQIWQWVDAGQASEEQFNKTFTDFASPEDRTAIQNKVLDSMLEEYDFLDADLIKRVMLARGEKTIADTQQALLDSLLGGLEFATGKVTLSSDTWESIESDMFKDMFKLTGKGREFVGTADEYVQALQSYIETNGDGIVEGSKQIVDALEQGYKALIEGIFKSPEELVKKTRNIGGFDEQTATIIGQILGKETVQSDVSKDLFTIEGTTSAMDALAAAFALGRINAYDFVNVLDESYEGMQGVMRLEEQIAKAREEVEKIL